jgi:predicted acyltransferase (DUF342 family)
MAFDKRTLVLPSGTAFEERSLGATGDIILGDHVRFGFGLRTPARVFLGVGVEVTGDIEAGGDLRADTSTHILGNARTGAGYLGERCFVQGDLEVNGDLDVGDDVRVGGRLQAKGWVNKRNPVPLVLYVFIYLLELMRLGHSEEVEKLLKELEAGATDADIAVAEGFLFVPDGSSIGLTQSDIHGDLDAADGVRILGNLTVRGKAVLGKDTKVCGALRCDADAILAPGSEVQGDLVAGGAVTVGEGCTILGSLHATSVVMFPGATVDGKIVATEGVSFKTAEQVKAEAVAVENVEVFAVTKTADLADLLG